MAYCTNTQVLACVDTDMSPAEVTELILRTDERIKLRIDVGSVNALILEDLSVVWTCLRVMLKDPNARGLGEYSERREVTMQMLKKEIDELIAMANGGSSFIAAVESVV